MTITCKSVSELKEALNAMGFFLVSDLPGPMKVEIRRKVIVARIK